MNSSTSLVGTGPKGDQPPNYSNKEQYVTGPILWCLTKHTQRERWTDWTHNEVCKGTLGVPRQLGEGTGFVVVPVTSLSVERRNSTSKGPEYQFYSHLNLGDNLSFMT